MSDDLVDYYRTFLVESGMEIAMSWTVVRGLSKPVTIEDVVRRMGGDLSTLAERPLEAAYDEYDTSRPMVHIAQPGPAVSIIENNGFQGTRNEMMRALSQDAVLHNVYWQVNGQDRIHYAVRGRQLAGAELVDRDGMFWWGDDPPTLAPEVEALMDADPGPQRAVGMAVIEARTGVQLEKAWFKLPQLSFLIPDPTVVDATPEPPRDEGDPDLVAWLTFADTVQRTRVRELLVDLLADRFDLERGRFHPDSFDDHRALVADLESSGEPEQLAAARTVEVVDDEPANFDAAIVHSRSAFAEMWPDVRAAIVAIARGSS
ncbi:hypothetical protein [Tenggerimyces flavus]|uniref:Uncharacterized protein n=1 Tax=Tenggerimyces flavus TaxID=1708749 RepID=A0ABV7YAH8_9ACTN|nr:hypothetical protein [Tenggerimyces flavus]MBM7789003.1 hypothetical protein [Tenggerimyces flavus]